MTTTKKVCPHCGQYINATFERALNGIQARRSYDDRWACTTLPGSALTPLEQIQKLEKLAKEFYREQDRRNAD